MVGHTGVFDAIVSAVETTDACLKEVVDTGRSNGYQFIIIADHGNADYARHPDGAPHTAHTTNPVPVVVLSTEAQPLHDGKLADVAPTVLKLMGIDQPAAMTGKALF
jgi:2,3-bisphosphoglycerate-independent phosphoglycerate mutase